MVNPLRRAAGAVARGARRAGGAAKKHAKRVPGGVKKGAGRVRRAQVICQDCGKQYPASENACPYCGYSNLVHCNCGEWYVGSLPYCPQCNAKNPSLRAVLRGTRKRTPTQDTVTCANCGFVYSANQPHCPNPDCNEPNPTSASTRKPAHSFSTITAIAGKGPQLKFFQILIYIIAAVCSIIVPPFFGLPSLGRLALGFIFIGIQTIFPSERQLLRELEPGETMSGMGVGFLTMKAMFKLLAFFVILMDLFMVNRILALVFGFIFYFSLPLRYKTSQPYNMILGWIRLLLGFYLAFQIFSTFSGPLSWPLGLLSAAFFISIPTHIEDVESGVISISLVSDKTRKQLHTFERMIFGCVMLLALAFFFRPFGPFDFNFGDLNVMMFGSVWLFSLISGISAGPEGRPAIGVVMILISLFVFSTTYTGYVGSAIFGVWWPQVQGFGETYLSPLNDVLFQAQNSLSDTWLIMTNPQQYYLLQQQKAQARKSIPTGTTQSIEFTSFDIYPSIPGVLEPTEPTVGFIELTNKGEYQTDPSVFGPTRLEIYSTWTDPTTADKSDVGTISEIECGRGSDVAVDTCSWSGPTYPTEIEVVSFVYAEDSWTNGTLDLGGECLDVDGNPASCVPGTTYTYANSLVKVNANLTYNYKVNVSIPIDVMRNDLYIDLLKNKQIEIKELTSYYTGGPVKATFISRKQPLRSNEKNIVIASLLNEGEGIIKQAKFIIKVPDNLIDNLTDSDLYATFDSCSVGTSSGFYVITCTHNRDIESGEFKRVSFFIRPDALDADVDSQTSLIVGLADYRYLKTKTQSLQLATAPPQ